jgi:hypothetical protein
MFSIIAAERKRREMDPVLETIRQCQQMLDERSLGKAAREQEASSSRASAGGHGRVHGGDEQDLPAVHRQREERVDEGVKVLLKAFSAIRPR